MMRAALFDRQSFQSLTSAADGVGSPIAPACPGAKAFPPPAKWRTSPGKADNRCYNYANDVFTTDTAVPGAAIHLDLTEKELHDLLVSDGLVPVTPERKKLPQACHPNPCAHLIAAAQRLKNTFTRTENGVAVPTFRDFHFLRLDANGVWSHKDGTRRPRNTDTTGRPLVDLPTAKFRLKHYWVGYYWTFPGPHRRIRHP